MMKKFINTKHAIWNSTSFIYLSLSTLVSFSLIFKLYDTNTLGLYLLISSVLGVGNNFDFGFGVSAIKHISEFNVTGKFEELNSFIVTFFILYICLSFSLLFLMFLYFYFFILKTSLVESFDTSKVYLIFFFLASSFFLKYLSNYIKSIFEGFRKFVLLSKLNIFTNTVNLFLILILFFLKLSIYYLAFFTLAVNFISLITLGYFLFSISENLNFSRTKFSKHIVKKYTLYNINIQFASFLGSLIDTIIKYLLGSLLALSYVSYFEFGKKIIDFTSGLLYSAQKGIFNKLSEEYISDRIKEFVNSSLSVYSKMSNHYSILTYGLLNPIFCSFIFLWAKNTETVIIYILLALPYTLINFAGSLYQVIMVEGKGQLLLMIQIINVVSIFSFLFVSLYFLNNYIGLISFYCTTILSVYLLLRVIKKKYDLNIKNYYLVTDSKSLFLLNFLLLLEFILISMFSSSLYYILLVFQLSVLIIFYKQANYFFKMVVSKLNLRYLKNVI